MRTSYFFKRMASENTALAVLQTDLLNVYAALASRPASPGFHRLNVLVMAATVMAAIATAVPTNRSLGPVLYAALSRSQAPEHFAAAILRAASQSEPPNRSCEAPNSVGVPGAVSTLCTMLKALYFADCSMRARCSTQQEQVPEPEPDATAGAGADTAARAATQGAGAVGGFASAAARASEPAAQDTAAVARPSASAEGPAARAGGESLQPLLQGPCLQCFLVWVLSCARECSAVGEASPGVGAGSSDSRGSRGSSGNRGSSATCSGGTAAGASASGSAAAAGSMPAALVRALRFADIKDDVPVDLFTSLRLLVGGPVECVVPRRPGPQPQMQIQETPPQPQPQPQQRQPQLQPQPHLPPQPQQQPQHLHLGPCGGSRPLLASVCVYDLVQRGWLGHSGIELESLSPYARIDAASVLANLLLQLPPRQAAARLPGLWAMLVSWLPVVLLEDMEVYSGIHMGAGSALQDVCLLLQLQLPAGSSTQQQEQPAVPCYSLRCALDAGLLGAVERTLRQPDVLLQPESCRYMPHAVRVLAAVQQLLCSSGVWPAALAHGPLAQVAGLVASLARVTAALANVAVGYVGISGSIPLPLFAACAGGLPRADWEALALNHAGDAFSCCLAGLLHLLLAAIDGGSDDGLPSGRAQPQHAREHLQREPQQQEQPQQDPPQRGQPQPPQEQEEWQDAGWRASVAAAGGGGPPAGSAPSAQQRLLGSLAVGLWAGYIAHTAANIICGVPEGPLPSDACAALRVLLPPITRVLVQVGST